MRKIRFLILFLLMTLLSCTLQQKQPAKNIDKSSAELNDMCVDWVKPIAVGTTKPFWPWSPDSEWIAYSNTHYYMNELNLTNPPETPGVYVIRYDGTEKRLLAAEGKRPSFGRYQWKIVFARDGESGIEHPEKGGVEEDIWMIDFDGKNEKQLTSGEEDTRMKIWGGPSLTYDGKYILYMKMDGGIGIVNADGTNPRQFTKFSIIGGYTPDGKKAFTIGGDEKTVQICTIEIENPENIECLTKMQYPKNDYWHFNVNLDGTMATFDNPRWENRNVWTAKLDGSNEQHPVTDYKGKFDAPGVTWANHPRFSPDGNWIIYDEQSRISPTKVKNKVMILNLKTGKKKEIYGIIAPEFCGWSEGGFSPDGKKMFFYAPDSENENQPSVWVAKLKEC